MREPIEEEPILAYDKIDIGLRPYVDRNKAVASSLRYVFSKFQNGDKLNSEDIQALKQGLGSRCPAIL